MKPVRVEIPNGSELADTLPKGLKKKIDGEKLIVWAQKWPHDEGNKLIKWFLKHGIPGADGIL